MKSIYFVTLLLLSLFLYSLSAWALGVVETSTVIDTSTAVATDTSASGSTNKFSSLSFQQTSLGSTTTIQTDTMLATSTDTTVQASGQISNKLNFLSSSWKLGGMTSSQNNFGAVSDTTTSVATSTSSGTSTAVTTSSTTQTPSTSQAPARRVLVS